LKIEKLKKLFLYQYIYAAFKHTGLTTRYRTKSLYKSIFVLSRSRDIYFMKRIKACLKLQAQKF